MECIVKTTSSWFKPQSIISFITGSFGQKIMAQTGIAGVLSGIVNFIRSKLERYLP